MRSASLPKGMLGTHNDSLAALEARAVEVNGALGGGPSPFRFLSLHSRIFHC